LLFSVVIGSGIQCFWMSFSTISFAALGFLSPANRGSFITAFLVLFILLGSVGGFFSARMYKTLNGTGYVRSKRSFRKVPAAVGTRTI
jgi:transmembrane 9 superfamily protein 2/4